MQSQHKPISAFANKIDRFESVMPDEEYRLLGMRSKIGGPFIREAKKGSEISASKLNKVQVGDFIYSRLFAWQGSFGIIPEEMDGCYVSNEFPLYSIDEKQAIPRYLLYWFGLPHVQKRVEADCSGSTPGTRNRFKEEFFEQLALDLPDVDVQHEKVHEIETLSAKKDRVINLREEVLTTCQAMLHSAFHQLIEGAPYRPMEEVAPIVRRPVNVKPDSEYPELGVRSFGKGTFHKPALAGLDVGSKKLFHIHPDDLVLSNVFAWEGAIAVAQPDDEGRVGSHRFITCVAEKGVVTPHFLRFYLLTVEGMEKIREASPGGAGRNRTLGLKKLEKITVPVPDYNKQLWFDQLQEKVLHIQHAQAENATELEALMPSILDKAFKGELS